MLRILRLKATDVHGYIPLDIKFDEQLTFLTGSNGCGKTSALKLIYAVLQPNFDLINTIQFQEILLIFSIESKEFKIEFTKVRDKFEHTSVAWTVSTKHPKKNISIDFPNEDQGAFKLHQHNQVAIFNREEVASIRETIHHEFLNSNYFKILQNISTPVLLGIDRKILGALNQDERKNPHYYSQKAPLNERSFLDAQRVIVNYVNGMADKKKALTESFKLKIFKSLFEYISVKERKIQFRPVQNETLQAKKRSVLTSIQKLDLGEEISIAIDEYYKSIQEIQPKLFNSGNEDTNYDELNEWFINRTHLIRIEEISKHADIFQKSIDELDRPLNEIVRIANAFFVESNKSLKISPSGFIRVYWHDNQLSSRNLSSGEMQIIVLLIHLVFCEFRKDSSVFVIDEPELSLHISWQEKFVDAILEASPSTQFILATHSPAIISKLEFEKKSIYIKNI